MFTIVGARGRVLGAGLADDVLMDLEPFVFVVASGENDESKEVPVNYRAINGPRWREGDGRRGTN